LAESGIRDMVAVGTWAVGLPALASRMKLNSMHDISRKVSVKGTRNDGEEFCECEGHDILACSKMVNYAKLSKYSKPPLSPTYLTTATWRECRALQCQDVCRHNSTAHSMGARLNELRSLACFRAPSEMPTAWRRMSRWVSGSILIDWLKGLGHCIGECRRVWGQDVGKSAPNHGASLRHP
jgi:hypothetical protein